MKNVDSAEKYVARLGWTLNEACQIENFLTAMERICSDEGISFLFKIDGERSTKKYTYVISIPWPSSAIIRMDTDDTKEGMMHMYAELERGEIFPLPVREK